MRKKALIIIISVVVAVVVAGGAIAGVVLVKNNQTGNDNAPIPESASFDFAVEQQFRYDGKQIEPIVGNLSDDDKSRVVYSYALKSDDDPSDEAFVGGLPIEVGTYYVKAEFGNEAKIATITVSPAPVKLEELSVVYNQPLTLAPDYFTSEFNPKNVEFEYLFTVNEQEVQGVLTLDADVLSPSVSAYSYTFTPNDKNFAEYKGNVDIRVFASVSYFKGDELYEYVETEFGSNFDEKNLTQRLGYDMPYWETGDHVRYTKDTQIVGDTKVYFHEDIFKYGITYHLDGGETDNPDFYTIEDGVLLLKDPTKQGYKFLGWYETATFAPESLIFEIDSSSQREYEIYAKFEYIKTAATVSFAPLELIYNSEAQALVQATVDGGTIKYSLDGSVFVETIPTATNAGEYKVYFKVDPDDKHLPLEKTSIVVTVSKANYDMSGVSFENKVAIYDGEEKTIAVSGALPTGVSVSYENNARTNAGEQTATAIFTGDSVNYNAIDNMSATLTIAKADAQLVNPTAIENLVFNGSAQALVNAGEAMGGTLLYSLDDTAYSESIPQGTKARSYTVYFKVVGDDNHNGIDATNFVVSIAKADAILNAPTAKELTFNGHTQALVNAGEVTGGTLLYSLDGENYGETIPQATNADTYTVYFKVDGEGNYQDIPADSIAVAIAKAAPMFVAPLAHEGLVYNGNAQELVSTGAVTGGTLKYSLDGENYGLTIPTGTNAGEYTVYFKVDGDENHNDISADFVQVAISKANVAKSNPKANNLTYNGTAQALISAGNVSAGSIEYALGEGEYSETIPASTNAGDYVVNYRFVLSNNYEPVEGGSVAVCIAKATYDMSGVAFEALVATYDGTQKSVVISGDLPSGVSVEYQNNTRTNAGSQTATAIFLGDADNYNAIANKTATLTIEKAAAVFDLTNVDTVFTYTGSAQSISGATATGEVTYEDNSFTNAGNYTVKVLSAESENYLAGETSVAVTVNKATFGEVVFNDGEFTYDGTAKFIYISTVLPSEITVEYTNNGQTNAGEYEVIATFEVSANYNAIANKSATLTIAKANYDMSGVNFDDQAVTYTGEAHSIEISGDLPLGVSVNYQGSGVAVGEYTISASFLGDADNYNAIANKSATLTIEAATLTGVEVHGYSALYDGNGHDAVETKSATTVDGSAVTWYFSADNTNWQNQILVTLGSDSGTYYYKATAANHLDATGSFVVVISTKTVATIEISNLDALNKTYDGTQISTPVVVTNSDGAVTISYSEDGTNYSATKPTDAGTYRIKVEIAETEAYTLASKEYSITISKATYDMSGVAFEALVATYDGTQKSVVISGDLPSGVSVEYQNNTRTNAGSQTATAIFLGDADNYNAIANKTATLTIEKAAAVFDLTNVDTVFTYTGSAQSISGATATGEVTYEDNSFTNAGNYTVKVLSAESENYLAGETSVAVTVNKATFGEVVFNDGEFTYDGTAKFIYISTVLPSEITVEYTNNGQTNAGEYEVIATFEVSANYNAIANKSATLTIAKATATVTAPTAKDLTYTGAAQALVNAGSTACGTIEYNLNGGAYSSSIPQGTTAGAYTVGYRFNIDANNYNVAGVTLNGSVAVTISKATYDMSGVSFEDGEVTYDGSSHSLTISGNLPSGVNVEYSGAATNAGYHTITATFSGDATNYNAIPSMSATLTIAKATATVTAPTAKDLMYTGAAQALVNAGSTACGTIEYNLNGGAYSSSIPQGTTAGAYTVGYRFNIDANNYNVAGVTLNGSVAVTIAKANYDMSGVNFVGATKQYTGAAQTLAISGNLPSGVSVNYVGSGKTAGNYTITAKFTGDTTNYNSIPDKTATLTISPKALSLTGIVVANKYYDGTTSATVTNYGTLVGVVSGDDVSVDASGVTAAFASASAGSGVQVALTGYALKGEDKANYTIASNQTAVANISKLNATITSAPTAKSLTYSASAQQLVNAGSATGGTLVYSLDNSNFSASVPTATNAGNYKLYYKVNGDANHNGVAVQSFDVTIQKATLTLSTSPISVNYNASNRTWDAVRSSVLNGISYAGLLGSDTTTITVLGMHNGKYKYGTVSGSYIAPDTATFGSNYSNVIGSTYAAYVSSSNANYQFAENANYVIVKYKTAMISSTYYTVEDAIGASGTITFAGDSSSATSYVATMFSSLPTSMTGYATSYTISGRTVIVPFKNTTDEYVKSDYKNLPASNVYSALIIPEGKTLNFTSSAKLAVGGDIGYKQPNTTVTCVHGVVINDGAINLASGCTVNSYGYIKGEGKLNLASGATALDVMHTYDWPGGNTATSIKDTVLPLNAWTLHNISCELILNHGSTLNAQFYAVASSANVFTSVCIVSSSSSNSPLFVSSGGYARKYTQKATSWADNNANAVAIQSIVGSNQLAGQKDIVELNGTFVDSSLKISVLGFSVSTSTSICCPLGYTDIYINTGANLTLSKTDYLFMPGTRLVVEEGATLTVNSGVDLSFEKWANTNKVTETVYAFKKYCVDKVDAYMVVNGTFVCKGNIGGIIKTNSANATLNLSSATLTSSHKSLMNAVAASANSSSDCAYQISGLPAQGYFDNTSTLYAFDKATYTSQNVSGTYCWSGTQGSSNPGDGTYSTTCSVGGSCLATGTLITLADGTQKAIENVTYGDKILVWNFFTGKYEAQEIAILVYHGDELYNVLNLVFSDGTKLRTIGEHGVFDYTLNKYVYPTEEDYLDFIGHQFVKYNNSTGTYDLVTLDNAYYQQEYTGAYSITSAVTSNALAEGVLSVAPPDDFYNWVEMSDKLRYDNEKFEQDVATYGLYTYDDFKDYVTYETFVAFNGAYLKIAVEKGYFTFDRILELIEMYHAWMPL